MTNFLNIINSNVEYAIKATENSSRGKFFLVVEGDRIISFNKTKRGAEGYIKKNTFSYYDDYIQDMHSVGKEYRIIELCALDIVDYFNNKEIWFETIFSKWKIGQNNNYTLIQAEKMECSQEVINFIKLVLSHVDAYSFPSKEMVGLSEVEEVEEIQLNADEEIIEELVSDQVIEVENNQKVSYKLNDEKNGIEIYFDNIPTEEVRNELKSTGFRWSRYNKCWYAKQSEENISLAKKLTSEGVNSSENVEVNLNAIELVEFVEVDNYKINEETEKRLINNSLFGDMRKVGYETTSLQKTLNEVLNKTKEIIDITDNDYYKNKLIKGFNCFCDRYSKELNNYLYTKSVNVSWAVTGRGGLNVSRYNKKQESISNKIIKVVEMLDKQHEFLDKFKNKIKKEERIKEQVKIKNDIDNLDIELNFKTEKREIEYYGYKYNTRAYISDNYFIMKLSGCYRIFENDTNKEVHRLNTTEKLDDAKAYVMYLEHELINKTV